MITSSDYTIWRELRFCSFNNSIRSTESKSLLAGISLAAVGLAIHLDSSFVTMVSIDSVVSCGIAGLSGSLPV